MKQKIHKGLPAGSKSGALRQCGRAEYRTAIILLETKIFVFESQNAFRENLIQRKHA
jgi:hypothetical protein